MAPPHYRSVSLALQSGYAPHSLDDHFPYMPTGEAESFVRREGNRWEVDFPARDGRGADRVVMTEEMSTFDIVDNSSEPEGKPGMRYRFTFVDVIPC